MEGYEHFENLPKYWVIFVTSANRDEVQNLILNFIDEERAKVGANPFRIIQEGYYYGFFTEGDTYGCTTIGCTTTMNNRGQVRVLGLTTLKQYLSNGIELEKVKTWDPSFNPLKDRWRILKPSDLDFKMIKYKAILVRMKELGLFAESSFENSARAFGFNGYKGTQNSCYETASNANFLPSSIDEIYSLLHNEKLTIPEQNLNLKENVGKSINIPRKTATVVRGEVPTVTGLKGRTRKAIIASYDCTAEARSISG